MKESRVSYRYAKSLLQLAVERNELKEAKKDMDYIHQVISDSNDLFLLLKNPIVKTDKKQAILHEVFDSNLSVLSKEFIKIITQKKRESHLKDIASSFQQLYKVYYNIASAEITTAVKMDAELREKILGILKSEINSEVEVTEKVDANIIGGFILRVKDKQIDTSISRKINDLKQEFSKNPYIKEI